MITLEKLGDDYMFIGVPHEGKYKNKGYTSMTENGMKVISEMHAVGIVLPQILIATRNMSQCKCSFIV